MKDQVWMVWALVVDKWWPVPQFWGPTRREAINSWCGKYDTMADWRKARKAGCVKCVRTTLTVEE